MSMRPYRPSPISREGQAYIRLQERCTQLRQELTIAEEGLANYQQELQRIRQESLTWSLVCQCDCAACEKLFSMIKHAVPQTAPIDTVSGNVYSTVHGKDESGTAPGTAREAREDGSEAV